VAIALDCCSVNDKQILIDQWHWVGGGRSTRRARREPRHRRSQQDQDAYCVGSHQDGGREGATVATFIADLSSQASVRRLAAEVLARYPKLDVLVNNAGAMFGTRQLTKDGIELTWAVNHLAPLKLLLHRLKESAPARIITTASQAHQGAHVPFDDLNAERSYRGFGRYGETKLANILFTTELARRLDGTGVTANCFHPGLVTTGFNRNNGLLMDLGMTILGPVARSPEKGAETLVWLVTSPDVANVTGYTSLTRSPTAPAVRREVEEDWGRRWR
jgi:NAD(P)-dependent dehydrogenase (short-subunit alcohol dehydrogenase family)